MSPAFLPMTLEERESLREVQKISEALFDHPALLIERATDVLARVQRIATKVGSDSRVRLHAELALVATLLDKMECTVQSAAKGELAAPTHKQLPKRRKLLPFVGGRLSKRRTAR